MGKGLTKCAMPVKPVDFQACFLPWCYPFIGFYVNSTSFIKGIQNVLPEILKHYFRIWIGEFSKKLLQVKELQFGNLNANSLCGFR